MILRTFEVHLALDSTIVLALRFVEYHPDPFARREGRIADVGYHALTLLDGHLDALTDLVRHTRRAKSAVNRNSTNQSNTLAVYA